MQQLDLDMLMPLPTLRFCRIHPDAKIPKQSRPGDAGYDVFACEDALLTPGQICTLPTGVRIKVPDGCAALVCPRSGLSAARHVTVHNAPGVIDANFTGELGVILTNNGNTPFPVRPGDRIAQLIVVQVFDLETVELTEDEFNSISTPRGTAGFGSSGR
jgi:dUTP pyrophosphatase